uniref:Transmembrane protein n=1 Tax=Medicago truncatula TaxID=3880 RepID=B7FKK1_MEDTR|nr:unknown [Medicago truncatula]
MCNTLCHAFSKLYKLKMATSGKIALCWGIIGSSQGKSEFHLSLFILFYFICIVMNEQGFTCFMICPYYELF